jgi:hypothetical protein
VDAVAVKAEAPVDAVPSKTRRKRKDVSMPSSPPSRRTRYSTGVKARTVHSEPTQEWDDVYKTGKVVIPVAAAKSHRDVSVEVTSSHIEYCVCNGQPVTEAFPRGYIVDACRATTKWDLGTKTITMFCRYTPSV